MVAIEHMVLGSGHAEDAFCYYACSAPDSSFCCLAEVTDSGKLEPMKATDTKVCTTIADIR